MGGKARLNLPGLQSRAVFHAGKGTQKNQAPGCRGELVGGKGGGFRGGDQHREAGEPQPGEGGHGDVLQQEVAEVSRTAGLEGQAEGPGLYCEAASVRGLSHGRSAGHCARQAGGGVAGHGSRGRRGGDCGKRMQEADNWRKQSPWPYLTSFLPLEKSPTWPGLPGRSMSWPGSSSHTLWSGVECPGLHATSCQASRVTRRGPVCASGLQDGCGPSRETPLRVSLCSALAPTRMDLCSLPGGEVPWGRWRKQEPRPGREESGVM